MYYPQYEENEGGYDDINDEEQYFGLYRQGISIGNPGPDKPGFYHAKTLNNIIKTEKSHQDVGSKKNIIYMQYSGSDNSLRICYCYL